MREIKFRAWDGEKMHRVFYLSTGPSRRLFCIGEHQQELDGVPVMQYTGLKDKNGQEIYEGDIIGIFTGYPVCETDFFTVRFEGAAFYLENERGNFHTYLQEYAPVAKGCIEIDGEISGNIYENPELLTKRPSETKDLS